MEAILTAYEQRLQELIKDFDAVLDGLPQAALDWSPGPELNSLTVLATHSVGSTRYWVGDVVAGDPSGRVRESEFQTTGVDAAQLRQRLAALLEYVRGVLSGLTLADLEQEHFATSRNGNVTAAFGLLHALAHLAEHVGHAQVTRQLWEQQGRGESRA
jgi:hypothetical protein